jgi:hypothetical protein
MQHRNTPIFFTPRGRRILRLLAQNDEFGNHWKVIVADSPGYTFSMAKRNDAENDHAAEYLFATNPPFATVIVGAEPRMNLQSPKWRWLFT